MAESTPPKQFPQFLKRNSFELLLLGFWKGAKYNLPSLSNEKVIAQFYKYFCISEDDFIKKSSAEQILYRAEKELTEMQKQDMKFTDENKAEGEK